MYRHVVDILACPKCGHDQALDVNISEAVGDDIIIGSLNCPSCETCYPIVNGVPRFADSDAENFDNFDFQWNKWSAIQIDRLSGHSLSEDRFLADSRWNREWIRGKLILDAGCGAGRFADVAASLGANVIACDLSGAIDACRRTTKFHGSLVTCIQSSIYSLPLRAGVFDAVYCFGVIQHTPDPVRTIEILPRFLKNGGSLALNFYEKGWRARVQLVKYALRVVTRRLSARNNLAISSALVACFFPLTALLSRIRIIRQINHFIPIAGYHPRSLTHEQQRTWTLLDTFDWYGPKYEIRQKHKEVADIVREAGLIGIASRPGLVWARKADIERNNQI
jgi:2-polyprenyl-3-methyl-5-hydroxy-6-metoxy-1,4-benzoquinol methylase